MAVNADDNSKKETSSATADEYGVDEVLLFGELCGGRYPHPDVPPDPRVEAVQTGVYYSPTIEFYAFDIALQVSGRINEATQDSIFFVDYDKVSLPFLFFLRLVELPSHSLLLPQALELFRSAGILCAEPLGMGELTFRSSARCRTSLTFVLIAGSYEEMLDYPIEFESTIPSRLGLPALPQPNKAEGVRLADASSPEVDLHG